jgi:hypothetical protein
MRMLLNGTNREDVLSIHVDEFRTQMRGLDRKIEKIQQLAAEIANRFEAESAKD